MLRISSLDKMLLAFVINHILLFEYKDTIFLSAFDFSNVYFSFLKNLDYFWV